MISADKAFEIVMTYSSLGPIETASISGCTGKVLAQNICAERNDPPFPRVLKDGIAIKFDQLQNSNIFTIESLTRAGLPQAEIKDKTKCIEVMTGCPLPIGTDTVVMYEDIQIENEIATISSDISLMKGNNIAPESLNHRKGEILLQKGSLIQSAQIGIITSQGLNEVKIFQTPKITVITSGDEIVDLGQVLPPHKIRASNKYTVISELLSYGFNNIKHIHISDNEEKTECALKESLEKSDILILSGGVSKGKFDFIPAALNKLGAKKIFHKVKQKPGKPFWFGKKSNTLIFALPGNPISTLACLRRYVIPSLQKSVGIETQIQMVKLSEDVIAPEGLTYFLPMTIQYEKDATITGRPHTNNDSGHYSALANSKGIAIIPETGQVIKKGELVQFLPWGHQGEICL